MSRQRGFTLVEVLVALAILTLLFTLLFVPMLRGMELFHLGQARDQLQRDARLILDQITRELEKAMEVLPNDAPRTSLALDYAPATSGNLIAATSASGFRPGDSIALYRQNTPESQPPLELRRLLVGITPGPPAVFALDAPLANSYAASQGFKIVGPFPYLDSKQSNPLTSPRVSQLSRLDFILPDDALGSGVIMFPLQPESWTPAPTVSLPIYVTYYVRKRDLRGNAYYDPEDNPLLLYRAQYVPRGAPGPGGTLNLDNGCWKLDSIDLEDRRGAVTDLTCVPPNDLQTTGPVLDLPLRTHNALAPIEDVDVVGRCLDGCPPGPDNPDCSSPPANCSSPDPTRRQLVSDTYFLTHDTNGDGRVDRVTINLTLGRYDPVKRTLTKVQMRTDVALPNAK